MTSNPDIPLFIGYVETTFDALRIIYAALKGIIPRNIRRLNYPERRSLIKSGAVFVFCAQESQIKRWTGKSLGNFLEYREINDETTGHKQPFLYDGFPIPTGRLIKKTITVVVQAAHFHLISYYALDDIRSGKLKRPSTQTEIANLYIPPHYFHSTTFRVPPMVEIGPDGKSKFVEVEDSGYSHRRIPVLSPPPPSPAADATGRTHAGLQGTISVFKRNQQKISLATISLQRVFAAVLNILVVVHNKYANEEVLGMLAEKAGLFVLTVITFSDPHSMNSVIEGLRLIEEMNWVLGELNKSRISSISQEHIDRIEAKMIRALEILQKSNQ